MCVCACVEREKVCMGVWRERGSVCVEGEGGSVFGTYKLYNYVQLFVLLNDPDCSDSDKYVIIVHCYCCYCL